MEKDSSLVHDVIEPEVAVKTEDMDDDDDDAKVPVKKEEENERNVVGSKPLTNNNDHYKDKNETTEEKTTASRRKTRGRSSTRRTVALPPPSATSPTVKKEDGEDDDEQSKAQHTTRKTFEAEEKKNDDLDNIDDGHVTMDTGPSMTPSFSLSSTSSRRQGSSQRKRQEIQPPETPTVVETKPVIDVDNDNDNDDAASRSETGGRSKRRRESPYRYTAEPATGRYHNRSTQRGPATKTTNAITSAKPQPQPPRKQTKVIKEDDNNREYHGFNDIDILCSHSKAQSQHFRTHPGNQRYKTILKEFCSKYQNSEKGPARNAQLDQVVNELHANGARFMVKDKNNTWVEMGLPKIRMKVSNALRAKATTEGFADPPAAISVRPPLFSDVETADTTQEVYSASRRSTTSADGDHDDEKDPGRTSGSDTGVRRIRRRSGSTSSYSGKSVSSDKVSKIKTSRQSSSNDAASSASQHKDQIVQDNETTTGGSPTANLPQKPKQHDVEETVEEDAENDGSEDYGENDVLSVERGCKRRNLKSHPGNLRYAAILGKYSIKYQSAERGPARKVIYQAMLDEVQSKGARFLMRKGNAWVEMEAPEVLRKIWRALQHCKISHEVEATCASVEAIPQRQQQQERYEYEETLENDGDEDEGGSDDALSPASTSTNGIIPTNSNEHSYTEKDILCVRGPGPAGHPGNQRYLSILKKYCTQYHTVPHRKERQSLLLRTMTEIQSNGARFMAPHDGGSGKSSNTVWVEMDSAKIRSKVSMGLLKSKQSDNSKNCDEDILCGRMAAMRKESDNSKYCDEDILCGRNMMKKHPGNDRYRKIIAAYYRKFQQATRDKKGSVVQEVLEKIKSHGGRFMEQGRGSLWVEMDNTRVMAKVQKALHECKTRSNTGDEDDSGEEVRPRHDASTKKRKSPSTATNTSRKPSSTEISPSRPSRKAKTEAFARVEFQAITDALGDDYEDDDDETDGGRPRRRPRQNGRSGGDSVPSRTKKTKTAPRHVEDSGSGSGDVVPPLKAEQATAPPLPRPPRAKKPRANSRLCDYQPPEDPNPVYMEEAAFQYHNPPFPEDVVESDPEDEGEDGLILEDANGEQPKRRKPPKARVSHNNLRPIPPPLKVPAFPNTGYCQWSWDATSRVLLANFSAKRATEPPVASSPPSNTPQQGFFFHREDELFFLEMLERNDLTVIAEGLISTLDDARWDVTYLNQALGEEYFHKFRRFDRVAARTTSRNQQQERHHQSYEEVDKSYSMKMCDFVKYWELRKTCLQNEAGQQQEPAISDPNSTAATSDHQGNNCDANSDTSNKGDEGTGKDNKGDGNRDIHDVSGSGNKGDGGNGDIHEQCDNEVRHIDKENDTSSVGHAGLFEFVDDEGTSHTIDVVKTSMYMIDFDLGKLLPLLYEDFMKNMQYPGIMPGGSHCMMDTVTRNAQPFMGPNMYITPPGSFTHFHQDGHGTVDSGHFCISGYNEVVMLRRLTERHKKHALWLLTRDRKSSSGQDFYDGLYQLPHDDNLGTKPAWPSKEAIKECEDMGYCPSVCLVKPGQLMHINKGRLHAFRKLSSHELPATDCHADLRRELVEQENLKEETLCISVAWDWMYRGVSAEGINREVVTALECAALNRNNLKLSLAIPELSLLQMARMTPLPSRCQDEFPLGEDMDDKAEGNTASTSTTTIKPYTPSPEVICRGILPGLRYVVQDHLAIMKQAHTSADQSFSNDRDGVSIAERPKSDENLKGCNLDPYGNTDFFCKLCHKELSNVYYECDGCAKFFTKRFNICQLCHTDGYYKGFIQMHCKDAIRDPRANHIGNFTLNRRYKDYKELDRICPCKRGPDCPYCSFCMGCSCRCHSCFTQQYRFFTEIPEQQLLDRVAEVVESIEPRPEPNECLDDPSYIRRRFAQAANLPQIVVEEGKNEVVTAPPKEGCDAVDALEDLKSA